MEFFTVSTFLTFQPNLKVVGNQIEECGTILFNFFHTAERNGERKDREPVIRKAPQRI